MGSDLTSIQLQRNLSSGIPRGPFVGAARAGGAAYLAEVVLEVQEGGVPSGLPDHLQAQGLFLVNDRQVEKTAPRKKKREAPHVRPKSPRGTRLTRRPGHGRSHVRVSKAGAFGGRGFPRRGAASSWRRSRDFPRSAPLPARRLPAAGAPRPGLPRPRLTCRRPR